MERYQKLVCCFAAVVLLGAGCAGDDESAGTLVPDPTAVAAEQPDSSPSPTDPPALAPTPTATPADVVPSPQACGEGSDPDRPGPIEQARPADEGPGQLAAFDSESGVIVMVARGKTWAFDVCTNTWTEMTPMPGEADGLVTVVYDADSDLTVVFSYRETWAYDVDEDAWSAREPPSLSEPRSPVFNLAIYDPVSGQVVTPGSTGPKWADQPGTYWAYDVESDRWEGIDVNFEGRVGTGGIQIGYHPQTGEFIPWAEPMMLVNFRDGSVRFDGDAESPTLVYGFPPPPILTGHDPVEGLGIIHTLGGGELHAYDPSIPGWTVLYGESDFPDGPYDGRRSYDAMVYDTINERLVVIGGVFWAVRPSPNSRWLPTDDVWALDTVTGEWTQLLAPSKPAT